VEAEPTDRTGDQSVAVVYLARGQGEGHVGHFETFVRSYKSRPAGLDHRLYVVFKGFADRVSRAAAERAFDGLAITPIDTDDLRFDIGAYTDALPSIAEGVVCFLNTYSEITSRHWLHKMVQVLKMPGVGMVGATGTYESLHAINRSFPQFPNPHLRTNGFMLRRAHAEEILGSYEINDKLDTFFIESGARSMTRKVFELGLSCLLVGADGRGFTPEQWARSGTYRLGLQENLLLQDNYTREFTRLSADERHILAASSWGTETAPDVVDL
jgi:hypothetical protein